MQDLFCCMLIGSNEFE